VDVETRFIRPKIESIQRRTEYQTLFKSPGLYVINLHLRLGCLEAIRILGIALVGRTNQQPC